MTSARKSYKNTGPMLPGFEMFENVDATISPSDQHSSQVECPANQPVQQVSDKESQTSAGSGEKQSGSSKKSSRAMLSSRTWPVLGRSMMGIPIEKSYGHLPISGTMLNGHIFALPMLVLRTDESASLSWPTPMWVDGDKNSPATRMGQPHALTVWPTIRAQASRTSRGALTAQHWSMPSIEQAVELSQGILPREYKSMDELPPAAQKMWATPRAEERNQRNSQDDYEDAKNNGAISLRNRHSSALNVQASWATPNSRDWKGAPSHAWDQQKSLPRQIQADQWPTPTPEEAEAFEEARKKKLNPDWVCSLMGYPNGWLDLDEKFVGPADQDKRSTSGKRHALHQVYLDVLLNSKRSAIALYRKLYRQSLKRSMRVSKPKIMYETLRRL